MYAHKHFVKTMLEDQDHLITDALTLPPRLLHEGLGDKTQPLTRPPWNEVAIRRCTGVGLGAVALGTINDITGTVLAKMSARRTPRAMGVRKSKVETF